MTSSHSLRCASPAAGRRCCRRILFFLVFKIMKMETDLITEDFDLAIAAVADRRRVAGIVEGVDLQVQRQALREEIN